MLRHKSPFRVSAVIIKDGKMLLIHRKKNGNDYFINIGGTPEKGESHVQTLVREVKEEARIDVRIVRKLDEAYNNHDERTHIFFLAEIISGEPKLGGPELERQTEANQYLLEWCPVADAERIRLFPEAAKEIMKNLKTTGHE